MDHRRIRRIKRRIWNFLDKFLSRVMGMIYISGLLIVTFMLFVLAPIAIVDLIVDLLPIPAPEPQINLVKIAAYLVFTYYVMTRHILPIVFKLTRKLLE